MAARSQKLSLTFSFVFFLNTEIFSRKTAPQKGATELNPSLAGSSHCLQAAQESSVFSHQSLAAGAQTLSNRQGQTGKYCAGVPFMLEIKY